MTTQEIQSRHQQVVTAIDDRRLHDAFGQLSLLIEAAQAWPLRERLEQARMSYDFMLSYLSQGIVDPQRDDVLAQIVNTLWTLADECAIALRQHESPEVFFARRRELSGVELSDLIGQYSAQLNKTSLLMSVEPGSRDRAALLRVYKVREQWETQIFNKIWSDFPTSSGNAELIASLIADEHMPEHLRCLVVMALFLGLMCYYDETKLVLLADAYTLTSNAEIQMRALIGVMLALNAHRARAAQSRTLATHIEAMVEMSTFGGDFGMVLRRLIATRNTDRVTRRVTEDIMPDIIKASPEMVRHLRNRTRDIDAADGDDGNPEWERLLEDSGLAQKMEEFNQLQLDGSDVFISTFSRLKTFPFFHTLSNWFLPYHEEHSTVFESFGEGDDLLRAVVTRAPFLCNSDRYSFCLSLAAMPRSQRDMMLAQSKQQVMELKEMEQDEDVAARLRQRDTVATRCVQDLYRFFNLFSRRREFLMAMDENMNFCGLPYLADYTDSEDNLRLIAEFYLKNGFNREAVDYFNRLLDVQSQTVPIVFQKLGYALESCGRIEDALRQYLRYELANENDSWTLRRIAGCYRQLGKTDEAISYYDRLDRLNPGQVSPAMNMGHALLESRRVKEALQYYYKADLMDDSRHRAWRPIAWCLFLLGDDEQSLNYYDRIIGEGKPTMSDHLNRGHVNLCGRRVTEAIADYRRAQALCGEQETFRKAMLDDMPHLADRGLGRNDVLLVLDMLQSTEDSATRHDI